MLGELAGIEPVAYLVLVYERPGPGAPSRDDLAWLRAFEAAITAAGVSVLGLYFATGPGVRRWDPRHETPERGTRTQDWPRDDAA